MKKIKPTEAMVCEVRERLAAKLKTAIREVREALAAERDSEEVK